MRRLRGPVLAAALMAAGFAMPVPAAHAATATAATARSVSLTLAAGTGTARPGEDLVVTGTITNLAAAPLSAGTLVVGLTPRGADRQGLERVLADPGTARSDPVASVPLPALPAGGGMPVTVNVPAAEVGKVLGGRAWGVHVLTGSLQAGGADVARSASGLVWGNGAGPAPVGVATIVPFTTPGVSVGLLDAQSLDAYTAPGGVLRKKLDAVLGTPAAIALDPRIVASIRALGSRAPASAVSWLDDLRNAANVIFPLSYADSDPALERSAGAAAVLAPGSFESALDPADFTSSTPETPRPTTPRTTTPTPGPTAGAGSSPTPTPTSTPGALPTGAALLDWNYTATDIAWPSHVVPGDLPFFAASGLTRALVPSSSLADPPSPVPATGSIEGSSALVVDSGISAMISKAAFSSGDAESHAALANASALLAATAEDAAPGAQVVVALDRSWPSSTTGLPGALAALRAQPWTVPVGLDQLPQSGTELAVRSDQPADPRVPTGTQLVADDAAIAAFSTAVERPELLTGRERLRLLAMLSTDWLASPEAWQKAAGDLHTRFEGVLSSVSLTSTNVTVVSPDADVPIFVRNDLDFPVTLTLDGRPSNGRILVDTATVRVDAQSSQRVGLPARTIVNGRVDLTVTARSASGIQIGNTAVIALDVQAEWEAVGTVVVIGLVVLLFGFGIYRNIRRRRRASTTQDGAQ